jgi:hypothetical protein
VITFIIIIAVVVPAAAFIVLVVHVDTNEIVGAVRAAQQRLPAPWLIVQRRDILAEAIAICDNVPKLPSAGYRLASRVPKKC